MIGPSLGRLPLLTSSNHRAQAATTMIRAFNGHWTSLAQHSPYLSLISAVHPHRQCNPRKTIRRPCFVSFSMGIDSLSTVDEEPDPVPSSHSRLSSAPTRSPWRSFSKLPMSSSSLTVVLVVCCVLCAVEASVHKYRGEKFVSKGNAFVVHAGSEGIYSSLSPEQNDTEVTSVGDAYIKFERIKFRRPQEYSNFSSGLVQAIVFEVEDRETVGGSAYGGQRAVCCTADLAKLGVCTEGRIIYRPSRSNHDWPYVFGVAFETDDEIATMSGRSIPITKTGMYNLYFIHCDPNLKDLTVEGKTIWKNPSGYLPGRMAPLMKFYGFMSLAFVMLGVFWFSQYAKFWREVLPLQNCITLVITLGMFEMALWYFDHAEFNETGIRPMGITIWAVSFGTVKRTVTRLIILMVAMGYGVVRPTLGGLTSKVVLLGLTFFLASEVLELVENVGAVSDLSGKAKLFLVLPVGLLDAFFIIWIFTSLSSTLSKLQSRRMMVKLDIYKKFTNALAVAVIVSVGWTCYELYFKSKDVYNEHWQNAWVIPAFWQVLSFSLLCVICALWAPSQSSRRYAYSADAGEEFDREETNLTLIKPSTLPSKDFRGPDMRVAQGSTVMTVDSGLEEEKTE